MTADGNNGVMKTSVSGREPIALSGDASIKLVVSSRLFSEIKEKLYEQSL